MSVCVSENSNSVGKANVKNRLVATAFAVLGLAAFGCQKSNDSGESKLSTSEISNGIIGGQEVGANDAVAHITVAIIKKVSGDKIALCTGSLLNSEFVVTAAHCVGGSPSDMVLVFGANVADAQHRQVRRVVDYAIPKARASVPEDATQDIVDIALIRFEGGLPAGFKGAGLLPNSSYLSVGQGTLLAGYGQSDGEKGTGSGVLRQTVVKIGLLSKTEVVMDQRDGHGACHGDSGGPAYLQSKDGSLLLYGVTSRGPNGCNSVGIYTNVIAYVPWMQSAVSFWRSPEASTRLIQGYF
jgi:hypothetical protein